VLDRAAIAREAAAGVISDVLPDDASRLEALCTALARAAMETGVRRLTYEELDSLRTAVTPSGGEEEMADPPVRVAPNVDLLALDEAHGAQGGTCQLCGAALARDEAAAHLEACAPAHDIKKGKAQALVSLRITAPLSPAYWLDVEMRDDAPLAALDRVLRRRWVECCEHPSQFRIGPAQYSSDGGAFSTLGQWRGDMDVRLRDVLPAAAEVFAYEYDFGSPTRLKVDVGPTRHGRLGQRALRLLARNVPPVWPCQVCSGPAEHACAACQENRGYGFLCEAHRQSHDCGEAMLLPIVNSPRVGVCWYAGEEETR
jgi:hypothetical protein